MSFKKPKLTAAGVLTGIGSGAPTPTGQYKAETWSTKAEVNTPELTDAEKALQAEQRKQSAALDAQENDRRKRLLNAMQGTRAFRGSAISRGSDASSGNGTSSGNGSGNGRMFVGGGGGSGTGGDSVPAGSNR